MIYKTLDRKLKIEHHELHYKAGLNSCAAERYAVPAPIMLLPQITPSSKVIGLVYVDFFLVKFTGDWFMLLPLAISQTLTILKNFELLFALYH